MSKGELDWLARLDGREFELGFTTQHEDLSPGCDQDGQLDPARGSVA
jgi:hypothetical protein